MTPPPPLPAGLAELTIFLQALLLFIGGAAGAFCRAACSVTQQTLSRRTIADVLIGGFIGVLLPILPLERLVGFRIDATLTAYQLMALAGIIGFVGNWTTTLIGWRLGVWGKGGGNGR